MKKMAVIVAGCAILISGLFLLFGNSRIRTHQLRRVRPERNGYAVYQGGRFFKSANRTGAVA